MRRRRRMLGGEVVRVSEHPAAKGIERPKDKVRTAVVLFVILPCLALLLAWIWVKHQRSILKDRGAIACIATKHDEEWCAKAASAHHERCIELTFRPGTRTSGESFDTDGYVECLGVGPEEYWRLSSERAAERRRANQSGPSYH